MQGRVVKYNLLYQGYGNIPRKYGPFEEVGYYIEKNYICSVERSLLNNYYFCIVKYFCFILSIYFLWLSTVTCTEGPKQTDTCQSVTCAHIVAGDDNGGDGCSDDVCSPFCTCSCCFGFTLVSNFSSKIILSVKSPALSLYSENQLQEISLSIWQPPKI